MSTLSTEKLSALLSNQKFEVSYSLFGTPWVSSKDSKDSFTFSLDELTERAFKLHFEPKTTPEKIIINENLISKVSDLHKLSKQAVAKANLITRLFIWLRNLFSSCKILPSMDEEVEMSDLFYVSIPRSIAEQNNFLSRHPPKTYDSFLGDALYTRQQVSDIYKSLPPPNLILV